MHLRRPVVSVETLLALAIAYLLAACNTAFWRAALAGRPALAASTMGFALALAGLLAGLYFIALTPLSWRWTARPLLAALIVISAAGAYFSDHFAVYFDRAMLRNLLATDPREAGELLSWGLAFHVCMFGLAPALALWWPRLKPRPAVRALGIRAAWTLGAVVLAAASIAPVFADFASLMRNHKEVRHLAMPGNLVAAASGALFGKSQASDGARLPVGQDARMSAGWICSAPRPPRSPRPTPSSTSSPS